MKTPSKLGGQKLTLVFFFFLGGGGGGVGWANPNNRKIVGK
jgi:hypothetical protein